MEEEKSLKQTKVVNVAKKVIGGMAAIGGAALAGVVLKNVDTKTVKGIGKIFIPVGVFGLSHMAGCWARTGAEGRIDDTIDTFEMVVDTSDICKALEKESDFTEVEPIPEMTE